jgi:hypothetical protein
MNNTARLLAFLQDNYSETDCALIGCHADPEIHSHACCEYDIVSFDEKSHSKLPIQIHLHHGQSDTKEPVYEVIKIGKNDFYDNADLYYSEYIPFLKPSLRSSSFDHFKRKGELFRQSIQFNNRTKIVRNIYNINLLINNLNKENSNTNLLSLDSKICSLLTLRSYLQWYLKKELRPSHIRGQIKLVLENEDSKVSDAINTLLDIIESERTNKSILSRSERSIMMLVNNNNRSKLTLLTKKINHFKLRSSYFDAMLLVYDFATQYYQKTPPNLRYDEVLKRAIDVQNKEKITLLKEMKLLLKLNKNLL